MLLKLHRRLKAIGLLELMLALGLIAILIIMATRYYVSAQRSTRVNQATSDCQAIMAALSNYAAGGRIISTGNKFTGGVTYLQTAGLLSSPFKNPWGKNYVLSDIEDLAKIPITITGMPPTDCQQFATVNKASLSPLDDKHDCSSADPEFTFGNRTDT